jgi:hypothetical protein
MTRRQVCFTISTRSLWKKAAKANSLAGWPRSARCTKIRSNFIERLTKLGGDRGQENRLILADVAVDQGQFDQALAVILATDRD